MKNLLILIFACIFYPVFSQNDTLSYKETMAHFREEYKNDHLENPRSPIKADDLADLRFFEADEKYRVTCTFELTPGEKPFDMPTYSGRKQQYVKYGTLHFELDGKPLQLAVYQSLRLKNIPGYSDHRFLPFRDLTNGETTYGGGRYIDLKTADLETEPIVLDFNKCYNPWCSYSDGFSCPIPPSENTLEVVIEAGEQMFAGEKKH